jgi:hypothetical protein
MERKNWVKKRQPRKFPGANSLNGSGSIRGPVRYVICVWHHITVDATRAIQAHSEPQIEDEIIRRLHRLRRFRCGVPMAPRN